MDSLLQVAHLCLHESNNLCGVGWDVCSLWLVRVGGVLISKYVRCKEEGRIIIVGQTFRDKSVILAYIYAPNHDNHVAFVDLESKLLESGGPPRGDSNIGLDQTHSE